VKFVFFCNVNILTTNVNRSQLKVGKISVQISVGERVGRNHVYSNS